MLGKKAVDIFTTLLMDTGARTQKINMKFVLCGCIVWIRLFVKCCGVKIQGVMNFVNLMNVKFFVCDISMHVCVCMHCLYRLLITST